VKYIILSILVLFSVSAYSQIEDTPLFVGKYFGNQSGGGSGYWQVTGNFTDESGYYDATSIQVGDVLFFVDAGIGYHLPVTSIISASGSSFTIRVNNTGISGVAGVPNGPGGIYRSNSPKGIWPFTAGLTASDQQTLNSFLIKRLNQESVKRDTSISFFGDYNLGTAIPLDVIARRYNKIELSGDGPGSIVTLTLPDADPSIFNLEVVVVASSDTIQVQSNVGDQIRAEFRKVYPVKINEYRCLQVGAGIMWKGSVWDSLGGVGVTTLNQAIQANPVFKETIYQDSILVPSVGGATTNGLFQITPLDSTEHSAPFLFGHSATKYATGTNHVMYMGWNLLPGGGQVNSAYPAIGEGWENRWRPDAFIDYTEKHEVWATGDDTLRRISSWTLDNAIKEGGIYYLANRFSIRRKHQSNPDHFVVQGDARPGGLGAGISLANGFGTLGISYEKTTGSNSNSLSISNNYNTSNTGQFNISGFSNANFPFSVISMPTASYFAYADGTILQNSAGSFRILTNSTKSFFHQTGGGQPFESWYNGATMGVNVNNIGNYDNSVAFAVGGTTKGTLLTRLTNEQRNAISVPANSLLFYNLTDSIYQYWDGLRYRPLAWGYKGNYVRAIDFIGSTNNADVIFKRNSVENMRLTANGASIGRTSAGGVTNNNPNLRLFQKAGGQFPYAGISIDHENTTLTGNEGGSFINFTRRDSTQGFINYDYLELTDTRTIGSLKIGNAKNGAIRFQTNGLDRQFIKGDGKIGIGTIYPGAQLTINQNSSFVSPGNDPVVAGTSLLLIGANSTPSNIQVTSVDTFSRILFTNQNGTFGGGGATKGLQTLGAISFSGSDNLGFTPIYDLFRTKATSTWSSTSRPTYTEIYATPTGSTTQTKSVVIEHNGLVVVSGTIWLNDARTVGIFTGTGSPEGAITASVGSTFHRTNGGAATSYYVKEAGTGNTGWVAK